MDGDEALLARAESVLTQLKVGQGLTDEQASLLAALRIRLKGRADRTLEELLDTAGDIGAPTEGRGQAPASPKRSLDDALGKTDRKPSLDDVLAESEKRRPDWPS